MTAFSLDCLASNTKNPIQIILSDGSGFINTNFSNKCLKEGWIYAPTDRAESFAETYNRGMKQANGDFLVYMANDIFVPRSSSDDYSWDNMLIREIKRTGSWMAAPYLNFSDYPGQVWQTSRKRRTFRPSWVTFNLNMITQECYNAVGEIDNGFSGSFNDIDYIIRMRKAGGDVVICNAGDILHIGMSTISTSTSHKHLSDVSRFEAKYPGLDMKLVVSGASDIFPRSIIYRFVRKRSIVCLHPVVRRQFERLSMEIEPLLHRP